LRLVEGYFGMNCKVRKSPRTDKIFHGIGLTSVYSSLSPSFWPSRGRPPYRLGIFAKKRDICGKISRTMSLSRVSLFVASCFGLTGVGAGALGAHALRSVLAPEKLLSYETAVRYQLLHALLLLALGILATHQENRLLRASVWLATAGTLCFSGSIYMLLFTGIGGLFGIVTPIGGLMLLGAWGCLGGYAMKEMR